MLGTVQKDWFKQELLEAKSSHSLIVWVNSLPWIGVTGDDGWYLYTNERREIANFIKNYDIKNLCMISGDAHMLAIDDGTNSDYTTGGERDFRSFMPLLWTKSRLSKVAHTAKELSREEGSLV